MKVAVVGSRGLQLDTIGDYMPDGEIEEIISGGAKGIDTCAANFARANGIPLTELKPDYKKYGKGAPIIRNREIVERADFVVVLWDGKSKGSNWVIDYCRKVGKPMALYTFE